MQIDSMPVHAAIRGQHDTEPRRIAAALLLMDDPADDGLTTGWYWAEVPSNPQSDDLTSRERWTKAVHARQGPFRDGNTALQAAENPTPHATALAARLEQAAELIRSGEIDATPAAIADWLGANTGDTQSVGPDPQARRTAENPHEARADLAGGVPEPEASDNADEETPGNPVH